MIIFIEINGIKTKIEIDIENEKDLVLNKVKDILDYLEKEENKQPNF